MLPPISKIKGIHPGILLERELRIRNIKKGYLALSVGEFPQTISNIAKGKRAITSGLSLKLDRFLGAEEGYFITLQALYELELAKQVEIKLQPKPNMEILTKPLFWDIDVDKIDFINKKRFVIERVIERGNKEQIEELIRFYGKEEVINIIQSAHTLLYLAIEKAEKYLGLSKNTITCYQNSIPTQHPRHYYRSSTK